MPVLMFQWGFYTVCLGMPFYIGPSFVNRNMVLSPICISISMEVVFNSHTQVFGLWKFFFLLFFISVSSFQILINHYLLMKQEFLWAPLLSLWKLYLCVFGLSRSSRQQGPKYLGAICFAHASEGNQYRLIGIRIKEMDKSNRFVWIVRLHCLHVQTRTLKTQKHDLYCELNLVNWIKMVLPSQRVEMWQVPYQGKMQEKD